MAHKLLAATAILHSVTNVMHLRTIHRVIAALLCAVTLGACSDGSDSRQGGDGEKYSALIERTQYGTAHVTADDWGSLGFGQGYATAQDRFCVLVDQFLKVRSQRARYFGPGENDEHINSDFAYLALDVLGKAESILNEQWDDDGRDMAHGYVAGINQYLADTGIEKLPGECAGQEWVQEVDVNTLIAYTQDLSMLAGSRNFLPQIASATPPGSNDTASTATTGMNLSIDGGSNAIALGSQRTVNGKGLLLANPHWPWEGERRFHEVHLTIPGEIDIAGITVPGLLGVMIGLNDSIAWSHTTSTSNQFIIYTLDLVPGNPTRYKFGDETREMQAQTYTIDVLQGDGSVVEQFRTLYSSHYGPMLDLSSFGLAWSETAAASLFDINAGNVASTFGPIAKAMSVDELRDVFLTVGGRPANNTLATDRHGEVFYADTTLVPLLSDLAEAEFRATVESEQFSFAKVAFDSGFVLLDGSDPTFSVVVDERAAVPGAIPFEDAPQLTGRRDFVSNSNDSYWLSNPDEPLTGYSIRYGDEETTQTTRTRMGLTQLAESELWDRGHLEELLFANRAYTAELWRDLFVAYCSQFDVAISSNGEEVNITDACQTLSNWDGRLNLESMGVILNRELMTTVGLLGHFDGKSFYTEPFDPQDPVHTPSGLSEDGKKFLLVQLADAVLRLRSIGIPLDAPLGDYQYALRGGQPIAAHGGLAAKDGAFNVAIFSTNPLSNTTLLPRLALESVVNPRTRLTEEGYPLNFGASFIMVVEFTEEGPVADVILTYSQSDDLDSPNFNDQMPLYNSQTWRPLPFTREQIEADPFLTSMRVTD